jgi:hypothetical protein
MLGGRGEGGPRLSRCGSEFRNLLLGRTRYAAGPRLRTCPGNCSSAAATAKLNGLDHLPVHEASNKYGQAILKLFRGEPGTNEGMNFVSRDLDDSGAEHIETVCVDQFARIIRLTISIL